jgi:hypothetical protein
MKVIYPKLYPIDADSFTKIGTSLTVTRLKALAELRQSADAILARNEKAKADLKTAETKVADAKKAAEKVEKSGSPAEKKAAGDAVLKAESEQKRADKALKEFKDLGRLRGLNTAYDSYVAALWKANENGTLLATVLKGEGLVRIVLGPELGLEDAPPAYVLFLKVPKAGGSTRITQNLWSVFSSKRVSYSGGAIVSYVLFDHDGTICSSGTEYRQTGYRKFKDQGEGFKGASY